MPDWVESATNTYLSRFGYPFEVELQTLKAEKRQKHSSTEDIRQREWKRIQATVQPGALVILLDESGQQLNTVELKNRFQDWRETGIQIVLLIGGADGVPQTARNEVSFCLSLSSLTLPHGLARIVLLEQLYRVATLLSGHPYHRT